MNAALRKFVNPIRCRTSLGLFCHRLIGSITQGETSVKIQWESIPTSSNTEFHYAWLRDSCPCPECYDAAYQHKLVNPLSLTRKPVAVSLGNDKSLVIDWPDGHRSEFSADFLKRHAYDGSIDSPHDKRLPCSKDMMLPPVIWDKSITSDIPNVTFQSVLKDDEGFLKWNSLMEKFGFCFVHETPLDLDSMKRFVDRIGVIYNTMWGDFFVLGKGSSGSSFGNPPFKITPEEGETESDSSISISLPIHTDGTYHQGKKPALQFFQLLVFNGELPLNSVVDGLKVAEVIRQQSEYHFQLLAHVPIPYQYEDRVRMHYGTYCIFDLEPYTDRIRCVTYADHHRMITNSYSHHKLKEFDPKATMNDFYEALHMFNAALNDDQLSYKFKLELGTTLFTHNHRVLHGRTAHRGQRALRGGYVDLMHWRAKVMATRKRVSEANKQ